MILASAQSQVTSTSDHRDLALDALKGFLVVSMVVYHALNYFSAADASVLGYLRFVNGSFVFLSGLAIALRVAANGVMSDAAARRTLWRGLRLLIVFTVLNLAISLLGMSNHKNVSFGVERFFTDAFAVYFIGEGTAIAFRILAPIAYVLMLAPLYLRWPSWRWPLTALSLLAALAYTHVVDAVAATPFFVLIGLVGLCAGLTVRRAWVGGPAPWFIIVVGVGLSVALMDWLSGNVLAYCIGMLLMLKLVYDAARRLSLRGAVAREWCRVGEYSLVAYIAQIAFLHGLRRLMPPAAGDEWGRVAVACIITTAFVFAFCAALALARQRVEPLDAAYRWVFG
jgi:peptidoglycan/LPS O-acetylase OafA/YrhL